MSLRSLIQTEFPSRSEWKAMRPTKRVLLLVVMAFCGIMALFIIDLVYEIIRYYAGLGRPL